MTPYSFVIPQAIQNAGAQVFLAMFNPADSGRIISIEKIEIFRGAVNVFTTLATFLGTRIDSMSGGTLQVSSDYGRLNVWKPEPRAIIRTGDPTINPLANIFACPNTYQISALGSAPVIGERFLSENEKVILQENEGFAIRTLNGSGSSNRYVFNIYWDEVLGIRKYDIINRAKEAEVGIF